MQPDSERWIDVGAAADLDERGHLDAEIEGYPATIVRIGEALYAFEDRCSHDGEPLAGAEIDPGDDSQARGPEVICPRHGARFCLRDGAALCPPAYEPIRVFPVRRVGGRIEVREEA